MLGFLQDFRHFNTKPVFSDKGKDCEFTTKNRITIKKTEICKFYKFLLLTGYLLSSAIFVYILLLNEDGFTVTVRDFGKRCMKPVLPKVPKQYEKEIFSNF